MKISTASLLSLGVVGTSAFAPSSSLSQKSRLSMSSPDVTPTEAEVVNKAATPAPAGPTVFGWTPDSSKPCYGLPGAIEPLGFFDPLELSKDADLNEVKRLREAEIMHGRVAMMATVGYLIGENTPTIVKTTTIANDQLQEMPGTLLWPLFLFINFAEAWRAANGWVEPSKDTLFKLREKYYPGGIGFDPLGLRPTDPEAFANIAEKELSNGRLAMIAVAGMCAQELASGMPLFY